MSREIAVNAEACPQLVGDTAKVAALFHFLDTLTEWSIPDGELSIVFLSHAEHCQLHADFLNDPSPTDVITFPGDADMAFAGEICLNVDQAAHMAIELGHSFSKELTLYGVHGWLHLAGENDATLAQRENMRKAEHNVLEAVSKANRLLNFKYDTTVSNPPLP